MGWIKIAFFVGCIWGSAAMATTPEVIGGEPQDLLSIQFRMAHLNADTAEDLSNPQVLQEVDKELYILELVKAGADALNPGSLMFIACDNAVCGGGDPGGCIKCGGGKK